MDEPTKEYIEELMSIQHEQVMGNSIKDYYSKDKEKHEDYRGPDFDLELLPNSIMTMRARSIIKRISKRYIITQVDLYQIPILGLHHNEPVTILSTDNNYIYIPIGTTRQYAMYDYDMRFIEIVHSRPTHKSIVSVLKDTKQRVSKL